MKYPAINRIILIQPPFIQLNGPYPSLYYLRAFLEKNGYAVTVRDHSIVLFERIFSRSGLERIFEDAKNAPAVKTPESSTSFYYLQRFFSEEKPWLNTIDRLTDFLRGRNREWGHFLTLANGNFPAGPRTDAFITEQGGEIPPDSANLLATKMLSDLADFITTALDPGLSLIGYKSRGIDANGLANDLSSIEEGLDDYIMKTFYRPFLDEEWAKLRTEKADDKGGVLLLGLTIPFPGCLSCSLVCAESARKHFGNGAIIIAGGGYVNTELRNAKLEKYFDHVSLDRPFAFLLSLLEGHEFNAEQAKAINDDAAKNIFPDYAGVDFSRYLFPVDDENPMHRLWSDGHWLKAYLAHGCYWHSCAFCDTSLDYIKEYLPVDPKALFRHLLEQAEKTGCRGIHLVDEAAPPALLLRLALLNREAGLPLVFWGNIRLEKYFNPDAAAILAAGGLVGVSTGIETPTARSLERMCKGVTLNEMVSACAAFKEAGILVHGYLIYGYWDQDEEDIINAAEIVRQLLEQDLLDSAFWHKFTLGCYSRLCAEKAQGLHPGLQIIYPEKETFALNNLSFKGEKHYDKYAEPLETLLSSWMNASRMAANTEASVFIPVETAFPFSVNTPTVAPDFIQMLLDEYARDRDKRRRLLPEKILGSGNGASIIFLGSGAVLQGDQKKLLWRWRLSDQRFKTAGLKTNGLKTAGLNEAKKLVSLLETASDKGIDIMRFYDELESILGKEAAAKTWKILRISGLAVF
jgi:hypothetical protein